MTRSITLGEYTIGLKHTDKVLFPGDDITKGDLVEYYTKIADVMLPYLRQRPITLHRFPEGIDEDGFYQQEASDYFPDWIQQISLGRIKGGSINHIVCNNSAMLVYIANLACITPHAWLSRADRPNYPDMLVFDLDPPDNDFEPVRKSAELIRDTLIELDLEPFVKTTGSRGLHVVVPLDRGSDFEQVRRFTKEAATIMAKREPHMMTSEQRKEKRKGRVFIDYLRNSYGQTAVAPYAIRAKPSAPVATPIEWDELKSKHLTSQSYTIKNIFRRLARKKDPWEGIWNKACSLDKARHRLLQI